MSDRRETARKLRRDGLSVGDIAVQVGASKSTVSTWVRDIHLTSEQINAIKAKNLRYGGQNRGAKVNRERHLAQRTLYQQEGRIQARQGNAIHLMGCMLYWAEGAKSRNEIHFVNSDPDMMMIFVRFLRETLHVQDHQFALHIHCHTTDYSEIARIERYWLALLKLPDSALKKTQIKATTNNSHNILTNGVCGIKVHSTALLHHIYGAVQEYAGIERPEWLG